MVDETTEPQAPELEEEQTSETESEETARNQEEIKSLQAQKEHFREKTRKLEEEVSRLKSQPQTPTQAPAIDILSLTRTIGALKDYSSDELGIIARNAKGAGISLEEASKLEDVQLTIQAMRQKADSEKKVPEPTSKGFTYKEKKLSELKKADLTKDAYGELLDKAIAGRRQRFNAV